MNQSNDQDVRKAFRTLHTFINRNGVLSKTVKKNYDNTLFKLETEMMLRVAGEYELLLRFQRGKISDD